MYLKIAATPGARKERFEEEGEGAFAIAVREPAERNLANRRIVLLIARHFKIPASRVRIVAGHRSPSKIVSVEF